MLSRTAENLYWLARYVERAEYLARTIEATLRVTALPNTYTGKTNEWDSALLTAGVSASFYEVYEEADERNVVDYLSFSSANPSSIRNCIENARLNSRSVRTALTSEMWDTINSAWIDLQKSGAKAPRPAKNWRSSCGSCWRPRCGSTVRPTGPCCATTLTGSRGWAYISSAPTTPPASLT
jgi:uncharacterized alpha-E superfamily protein